MDDDDWHYKEVLGSPGDLSGSQAVDNEYDVRITWGPSNKTILASYGPPAFTKQSSHSHNHPVLNHIIKRSSGYAGLASPTRHGVRSPDPVIVSNKDLATGSSTSASTGASTSTTITSRYSKRRRRHPIIVNNPGRDIAVDANTLSMFGELTKRIEAKEMAAQAEKEKESQCSTANSSKENLSIGRLAASQDRTDNQVKGKGKLGNKSLGDSSYNMTYEESVPVSAPAWQGDRQILANKQNKTPIKSENNTHLTVQRSAGKLYLIDLSP